MRPALERRARVIERQPIVARRRSARVLSRVAVLLSFDVAALLIARFAAGLFLDPLSAVTARSAALAGPLAPPGRPGSLVFAVTLFGALLVTGSYVHHRRSVVTLRVLLATAVAIVATAIALATLVGVRDALAHAASFGLVCFAFLATGRVIGEHFVTRVWPRDRGAFPAVRLTTTFAGDCVPAGTWGDYAIVKQIHMPPDEELANIGPMLQGLHDLAPEGVEAIVMTEDVPDEVLVPVADAALDFGFRVIFPARAVQVEGVLPRLLWHDGQPFFELSTPALRTSAVFTKRIFDVVASAFLLLVAAPAMLAIAIAIKVGSAGPVFFIQERAGLGGGRFRMLKFRTMKVGAEEEKQDLSHLNRSGDVRLFKIPGDPRVTRIGQFLRRWSFDELPQLLNVLAGQMSLVGPRPFFEADFAAYEDRHFRRLDTKPGITGLWQVSGRSDVVDFEDVIFLDRQYIEQWSLRLDLSILARTIPAVLRRDGAY